MIKQVMLLVGWGIFALSPLQATDLAGALRSGKVCERMDGFIQATPGNESDVEGLVARINEKRLQVYADIAAKDGLSAEAVGAAMAEQERAANPGKFCR